MSEMVLNIEALPEILVKLIPTKKIKIRQSNGVISLIPFREVAGNECPLLGLAADSSLTVENFLAMTREDRALEGLD